MRFWQLTCFAAAFAASPLCVTVVAKIPTDQSNLAADEGVTEQPPSFFILSAAPATFSQRFSVLLQEEEPVVDNANEKEAGLEQFRDHSADATSPKLYSSHLGFDPYAELPLDKKPADIVLELDFGHRLHKANVQIECIRSSLDLFNWRSDRNISERI
jgi:hypothetical protein